MPIHHHKDIGFSDLTKISTNNSTTATLAGGATFTGVADETTGYSTISIFAFSNVPSADGGLSLQTSQDGTNWDSQLNLTLGDSERELHTLGVIGRYFRVVYTNGASAQTAFRMQVMYHVHPRSLVGRMGQVLTEDADAQIVRVASEPQLDRAQGLFNNQSSVFKFGANPSVASSSTEDVIFNGTINWLTAATTVRIKSGGDAADTAAGAGARSVVVEGLDSNWAEVSETIATNGASASSATTASFFRVSRAYIADVGTYSAKNTGDITIENSAGGTDLVTIEAGKGQTQTSAYTVPDGKIAVLRSFSAQVDGNKAADLNMFQRRNADDVTAPFTGARLVIPLLQVIGSFTKTLESPFSFPAKTDLWWEATTGSGSSAAVSVTYELTLVDA